MKLLLITMIIFSKTLFASINDFECKLSGSQGEEILVEVERSFNSSYRQINLNVFKQGQQNNYRYMTTARFDRVMNQIEFFGGGIDLRIDLWPDFRPQWGRFYLSELISFDLDNGRPFYNIHCQFLGF